jgi:hypothetical protein
MDQEGAQPVRRGGQLNLSSLLVVLWVFRRAKKGEDGDRPGIVSTNAKSKAVLDHAKRLADEDREDERAVTELRALASGKQRTLRQAERASRFAGYHHERARANLANRLLEAALARESAPPACSQRDRKRIDLVQAFKQLTKDEQWAHLASLQPALLELRDDAIAGCFGDLKARHDEAQEILKHATDAPGSQRVVLVSSFPPRTDEEMRRLVQTARGDKELMRRLKPLIGPTCGHEDLLLSSQSALDAAHSYLLRPPELP